MKLTPEEYGIINTALRELRKIELKEAAMFDGFGTEESRALAKTCRENAEETEALMKKLRENIPEIIIMEG